MYRSNWKYPQQLRIIGGITTICNDCGSYVDKLYQLVDGDKICWDCLKKHLKEEWIDDIASEFKDEILEFMDVTEIK